MSGKKLLVFGSTGGTGRSLIEQSLELGWSVTAFARRPEALDDLPIAADVKARLSVQKGDLTSKEDVAAALAASKPDVLVFAAGKPWPAWSERMSKVTVYEEGITSVCEAMREAGLTDRRLIVIASTAHVGVPGEAKLNMASPWFFRVLRPTLACVLDWRLTPFEKQFKYVYILPFLLWFGLTQRGTYDVCKSVRVLPTPTTAVIIPAFLGRIYESMHRMEDALANEYKDINWVVVRPPQLKDGARKEKYITNANITTKEMKAVINRADLAHFLLTDAVTTSDEYKHISVCVCDS